MASAQLTLFIVVRALLPQVALGSLEAAVRRSSVARGATILPTPVPMTGPVVLPLHRQDARLSASKEASFYVGEISVGFPAKALQVVFDTSSGHIMLPHRACLDPTCLERRRYSPWESLTAMDVNEGGGAVQAGDRLASGNKSRDAVNVVFTQSDFGEGSATSVYVSDSVCVGANACVEVAVLAAIQMDEKPFRYMPGDGIVGLGLEGLSASPLCSFMGRMLQGATNVLPQFGIALGAEHGELYLGGHSTHLATPIRWFPVDHPEQGYWQVAIQAVRVGDLTIDGCEKGCHGIIDSGVSRVGVQTTKIEGLRSALGAHTGDQGCEGPDLTFDLGGMALTLQAKDYMGSDCAPLLGPLELPEPEFIGVYTFGAALLRRYYAAFDWEQLKLGFAPLAKEALMSQQVPTDPVEVLHV